MAEVKTKKQHVKKPPRVKKPKPVQNRCGICEHPCTPSKKAHDGCINRQRTRAKKVITMAVKQGRDKAKSTEIVPEDAQVKAEEKKQAQAKADATPDAAVFGKEGN